jgi:hypothetical protein
VDEEFNLVLSQRHFQAGPLVPGLGIGRPTTAAAAGSSISALRGRAQRPPHSSLFALNKTLRGVEVPPSPVEET